MLAIARSTKALEVLGVGRHVRDRDVEHRLGLDRHVAGEKEAGEIGTRDVALRLRRLGGNAGQLRSALAELGLAVEAPGLGVEHVRIVGDGVRASTGRDDVRQDQAGRPSEHDLVGGQLGADVVRERLYDHAVGRGERAELDEILALDEAARRRERGRHHQDVAGLGILEPMQPARVVERNGDAGARRSDDAAADAERPRRLDHLAAERDAPGGTVARRADQPRPLKPDAHHRAVGGVAGHGRAPDGAARVAFQGRKPDRRVGVEHQPQRIGTAEDGGRRRRREWKREIEIGALPLEHGIDIAARRARHALGLGLTRWRCGGRR